MDTSRTGSEPLESIESLGWNELVELKRKLSAELKQQSAAIVELETNKIQAVLASIRKTRASLEELAEKARINRENIEKGNSSLLSLSEKISQSKNFLSLLQSRLPQESEELLAKEAESNQLEVERKHYKSQRERDELLSKSKEATMKLEALRAVKAVNEQLTKSTDEALVLRESINAMAVERDSIREQIANSNAELDHLYNNKRGISSERESLMAAYTETLKRFELVNQRLDSMSQMRKRQREQYGYSLPNDELFKVKETARKKLESGSKLTFDELRLLYEDKTQS